MLAAMTEAGFPIDPLLPRIRDSLAAHPRLVLEAPPGAGKTTRVPPALLGAAWLHGRRIVMLEPRRVAARAAAGCMSRQLGEEVGASVGYRIRFERRVSAATRIEVVTEGILTRMLQDDPMLEGIGALLFDEFHERHLAADLGLALALDVQAQVRPDLRIVVMSATLDGERLAGFLDAPRITSEGRGHRVDIAHFPARRDEAMEQRMRRAVSRALEQHEGDVLAFLPGRREIARTRAALAGQAGEGVELLELHGDLQVEQQSRVLQPAPEGVRRVVLATNVAESSVTLPGVRVVIDSGLAREPRFDPNSGFSRLEVVAIAQSSADQRAGRAGRVAPGWAYRLWPASQRLEPQRRPEIAQVDLAGLALELAAWGSDGLRFPDPPPDGAMSAARDLLHRLGALQESAITPLGRRMLALGTHPRLAAMLLAPSDPAGQALACDLAALLEARDPLRTRSDALALRWQALAAARAGRASPDAGRGALQAIVAAAAQWRRRIGLARPPPREAPAHLLGALLAHGWPDRIARQHPSDPHRYQLANGRMARLFDDSALYGESWLVASELRFEPRDALVLRAAPVDEAQLRAEFADRFVEQDVVRWDAERRALAALRETRFDAIVLDARPAGRVAPEQAARALSDAVAALGLDALPWSEGLRQWRARVRCLRAWMPELGLPELSDDALLASRADWLEPAFAGKTRIDALAPAEFASALQSRVDWAVRERLEQFAPPRIIVPSGQDRRIGYGYDEAADAPLPPVLAVKLQEMFGLADTPRICDGRMPLTLHLLSPAGRPLQVTRDLRGFWDRTWPEVRKEMKGRYPKHPWPEDPWSAEATHRAKPRGS
jgi:ATP-dependent helicase HrpB